MHHYTNYLRQKNSSLLPAEWFYLLFSWKYQRWRLTTSIVNLKLTNPTVVEWCIFYRTKLCALCLTSISFLMGSLNVETGMSLASRLAGLVSHPLVGPVFRPLFWVVEWTHTHHIKQQPPSMQACRKMEAMTNYYLFGSCFRFWEKERKGEGRTESLVAELVVYRKECVKVIYRLDLWPPPDHSKFDLLSWRRSFSKVWFV